MRRSPGHPGQPPRQLSQSVFMEPTRPRHLGCSATLSSMTASGSPNGSLLRKDSRTAGLVDVTSVGGREEAVTALQALLDNPETTPLQLVEAATGLTEVGAEFHDRCAELFLRVLVDRTCDVPSRE